MLNATTLKAALKEIYGVDDKYIVPISTNWFIPTTDPEDKTHTWIGYRILSKKPITRAAMYGRDISKDVKVSFRLTFVGPQAEDLADQTLLWENRGDVVEAFGKSGSQINYTDRTSFTYPVRNGGYNDDMAWIVDMSAHSFYTVDTKQVPWFNKV